MKYFKIIIIIFFFTFLIKDLISGKQDKNEKLVDNINDGLIDLRNDTNF